jgi:hypothetical protein
VSFLARFFFVFSQSFPISFFFLFFGSGVQGVGLLFQEASLSCLVFFLFFLSFWSGIFSSLLSFVSLVVVG